MSCFDAYERTINLLRDARKYIEMANDDATAKHDNYGEYYMDGVQWDIMEDTEKILNELDEEIKIFDDLMS